MITGILKGLFTEKKLSDYLNKDTDWINARRIINGLDKAELIAVYAKKFYTALQYDAKPYSKIF
jgi:putative chitinase